MSTHRHFIRQLTLVYLAACLCSSQAWAEDLSHCHEGFAVYRDGDAERAIEHYAQCIDQGSLSPASFISAYINRGVAYNMLEDYKKAVDNYDLAIELDPDLAVAYHYRGYALHQLGRYNRAFNDYDRALILDLDYVAAYNNRGTAHQDLGQYQKALTNYTEAIRLDPNYAPARFNRCWTKAKNLGRFADALADCELAVQQDPDQAYALHGLGYVHQGLGETERAIEEYQQALAIDPDYEPAKHNLRSLGALYN